MLSHSFWVLRLPGKRNWEGLRKIGFVFQQLPKEGARGEIQCHDWIVRLIWAAL